MLKREVVSLAICLILIVLAGGVGFAQEDGATPTPEPSAEPSESPITDESPSESPSVEPSVDAGDETGETSKDEEGDNGEENEKITICHVPPGNPENAHTIEINSDSLEEHLNHGDYEGECEEVFEGDVDEELGDAGSKPGDLLYGVDSFFEGLFGNCLDGRKERIAEIRELVKEKKIEEAKEALRGYEECADELEREVSPEENDRAKRSSRAIRKAIREIDKDIPDEDKKEFGEIIDKEKKIEAAAEIAFKIKDLCEQLSKLDTSEYARVCKVKGDAPKWQIELDEDLTEEQKNGARKFAEVMSQCFKTGGVECRCSELEDINKPFADRCSIVAPLAVKCEDGDESACEAMDDATEGIEDSLPDYLLDIFEELEGDVEEDQFEFHMPKECRDAGAKTSRECMEVMFRENAPEECQEALREGKISFDNEREARESCERIMFEANAPQECLDAGLTDHRECGVYMFKQNAPQECIDAGLTGERKDDPRKCERLMREQFGEGPGSDRGPRGPNVDCRGITDSEERLKCYDGALQDVGEFRGKEGGDHGGWPPQCQEAQAFTRESCERIMNEWGAKQRNYDERIQQQRRSYENYYKGNDEQRFKETMERERACVERCSSEGKAWSFSGGNCVCSGGDGLSPEDRRRYEEERRRAEEEFRQRESEFRPPEEFKEGEFQQQPPQEFEGQEPTVESGTESFSGGTPTESSGTGGTSGGESSGSTGEATSTESGTSGGITGGVIMENRFTDYYYWG